MISPRPNIYIKANSIQASNPDTARCWSIFQRALMAEYFEDAEDLDELVAFLEGRTPYTDLTVQEITFELSGSRLLVKLLDDRAECNVADMIVLMKRLKSH
jgi:hypothetical protein